MDYHETLYFLKQFLPVRMVLFQGLSRLQRSVSLIREEFFVTEIEQLLVLDNAQLFFFPLQRGPNKVPVKALMAISMTTLLFILIGDMNRLATLATMPFLITYAAIEYSYFALCQQFEMNQTR